MLQVYWATFIIKRCNIVPLAVFLIICV